MVSTKEILYVLLITLAATGGFYGDENYDLDELDSEGFDGLDVEPPADLDQSDLF